MAPRIVFSFLALSIGFILVAWWSRGGFEETRASRARAPSTQAANDDLQARWAALAHEKPSWLEGLPNERQLQMKKHLGGMAPEQRRELQKKLLGMSTPERKRYMRESFAKP